MPESWEREVRKLGALTAPTSLDLRVSEGPRAELPPPRGQRILAAAVALGLFASVGIGAWLFLRPVHDGLVADSTIEPADVLVVACLEDAAPTVSTPVVRAHRDGIHVHVVPARDTEALLIRSESRPGWHWSSGSNGIEAYLVMAATPGAAFASCLAVDPVPPTGAEADKTDESSFTILDPSGSWVSTELSCGFDTDVRHIEANGASADEPVVSAARQMITGVRESDVVERAGYPEALGDRQEIRVLRDGDIVAWASGFTFDGSWMFDVTACNGSDIANV